MARKRKAIKWDELPDILEVKDVAGPVFGWNEDTFFYHARRGRVPHFRVGRRIYVNKAELMRYLGLLGPAMSESIGDGKTA